MNLSNHLSQSITDYKTLKAKLLDAMPSLAESDPECLVDTLEGITDTHEQLAQLVRTAEEDEALSDGLKGYVERLRNRYAWLIDRAQRKKQVALNHMIDLGINKITTPDMTISRRFVSPKVIVTDETMIPDEWCRIIREPDKTLIKKALKAGGQVPGCTLGNGYETIAVKI